MYLLKKTRKLVSGWHAKYTVQSHKMGLCTFGMRSLHPYFQLQFFLYPHLKWGEGGVHYNYYYVERTFVDL